MGLYITQVISEGIHCKDCVLSFQHSNCGSDCVCCMRVRRIFTMYTRTFPLDVACRVWDLFCRDGDCFLFRTALGEHSLLQIYPPLHLSLRLLSVSLFLSLSPLSLSLSLFQPCLYTSTGVLRLFQNEVMDRHTIEEVGQFLGHLPDFVDGDTLFQNISTINLTAKRFSQCLQQHSSSSSS